MSDLTPIESKKSLMKRNIRYCILIGTSIYSIFELITYLVYDASRGSKDSDYGSPTWQHRPSDPQMLLRTCHLADIFLPIIFGIIIPITLVIWRGDEKKRQARVKARTEYLDKLYESRQTARYLTAIPRVTALLKINDGEWKMKSQPLTEALFRSLPPQSKVRLKFSNPYSATTSTSECDFYLNQIFFSGRRDLNIMGAHFPTAAIGKQKDGLFHVTSWGDRAVLSGGEFSYLPYEPDDQALLNAVDWGHLDPA